MKKVILLTLALFLISITLVKAAPAMWGLALNPETKECAGYWLGDEFKQYDLPIGWSSYYPNYEKGNIIETDFGNCTFVIENDMGDCCKQLGYTYVSNNIGKGDMITSDPQLNSQQKYFSIIGSVIILIIIILFFVIKYLIKKRSTK